jgi:integrase
VFQSRSIRKAFDKAVEAAKLEDFRFHDLRHTAASYLVMRGASLAAVRAVLGHSDIKMTTRETTRDAHLSPEHLRHAVTRLNGLAPAPAMASVEAQAPAPSAHSQHNGGKIASAARVTA